MTDKAPRRGPARRRRSGANAPVRARTRQALLSAAMEHISSKGHVPSVAETAARAQVSRATAYRYFPTRNKLVTAVVDHSLGPVRSWSSRERDGRTRVLQLFQQTFPRFRTFEPQMRAAIQLSLEQWALQRAGLLEEEPYRRGHRRKLLRAALAPLRGRLSAETLDRLTKALSVVYGIEFFIVLKDIWGCTHGEVETIALWAVGALVDAAERSG